MGLVLLVLLLAERTSVITYIIITLSSAINVLRNIHQGNKCRSTMPPVSISWKCSAEEGAVGDDDAPIDEGIAGHLFLSL